jgi:hypothetical protein
MLKSQRKKDFESQRSPRAALREQRKAKACGGVAEKTYISFFLTFFSSVQRSAARCSVSSVVESI